jgi:hypothetical protein
MMWGLRLLVVGLIAMIAGGMYLYYGLNGGDPDGIFTDGLVKGPIGLLAGVALLVFAARSLRPTRPIPEAGVTWVEDGNKAPEA